MPSIFFHVTAPAKGAEMSDVDYAHRMAANLTAVGVDAITLTDYSTQEQIGSAITRHLRERSRRSPGQEVTPVIHINVRPPSAGTAFEENWLAQFKQGGGKVVCTAHEVKRFYNEAMSDSQKRGDAAHHLQTIFELLGQADVLHFVCQDDLDVARQIWGNRIPALASASLTYVPPTVDIVPRDTCEVATGTKNILCFCMLRRGKGLETDATKLASLLQEEGSEARVMIVGSAHHKDKSVLRSLIAQTYGVNSIPERFSEDLMPVFAAQLLVLSELMRQLRAEGRELSCGFSSIKDADLPRAAAISEEFYGPDHEFTKRMDPNRLRLTLIDLNNMNAGDKYRNIPIIPLDLYVNVPEECLQQIFDKAAFAYIPAETGLKSNLTTFANSLFGGHKIIAKRTDRTPPELTSEGSGISFAKGPHAALAILKELIGDEWKLHVDLERSQRLMEATVHPNTVAQQIHTRVYGQLGIDLSPAYANQRQRQG